MYQDNRRKFVIVIDRRKPLAQILNALCHVSLGLIADAGADGLSRMEFLRYASADGAFTGAISTFPNIVLQTDRSAHLRQLYAACRGQSVPCHGFTTTMLGVSAAAQQAATAAAGFDTLEFVLVAAFGEAAQLDPLTKRFSCWKPPLPVPATPSPAEANVLP